MRLDIITVYEIPIINYKDMHIIPETNSNFEIFDINPYQFTLEDLEKVNIKRIMSLEQFFIELNRDELDETQNYYICVGQNLSKNKKIILSNNSQE